MKFGRHTLESADGRRWSVHFPNDYGASIIADGYGSERGLYEVGVLHNGSLTYATPLTDDVIGWLTAEQVGETLDRIEALTEASIVGEQVRRAQASVSDAMDELRRALDRLRALIGGAA